MQLFCAACRIVKPTALSIGVVPPSSMQTVLILLCLTAVHLHPSACVAPTHKNMNCASYLRTNISLLGIGREKKAISMTVSRHALCSRWAVLQCCKL